MGMFEKIGGLFIKIKGAIMASTAAKVTTAVVAVTVIGGGVGITYAAINNTPEAVITKAIATTFTAEESSAEKIFGWQALQKAMKANGAEYGMEVSVNEIPLDFGMGTMTLPNAGMRLSLVTNTEGENYLKADVKAANTVLLSGELFAGKEKMQMAVPKLSDSVLTVNYGSDTFKEDLKNSYLLEYAGISQEMLDEILENLPEKEELPTEEEMAKELMEIFLSCVKDNFGEIKFEKAGKKEFDAEGTKLDCKVYSTVLSRGNVSDFLYEYTLALKEYFKELFVGYGIKEEDVEYLFYSIDQEVRDIRNVITDVQVDVYIHEKRLVHLAVDWGMDWHINPEEGSLKVTFAPEGNPMENMNFVLDLPLHQEEDTTEVPKQIDLYYAVTTECTEEDYAVDWQLEYNGTPLQMSFDYEIQEGSFTFTAGDEELSLTVNGAVNELEYGRKVAFDFEEFVYEAGNEKVEQELDVNFYMMVPEVPAAPLTGKELDVLAMTESDMTALEEEITANVYKLVFSMIGLFQ